MFDNSIMKGLVMMFKKIFLLFSRTKRTEDMYRAVLTDVIVDEISDGYLEFSCVYLLINHRTQEVTHFVDKFILDGRDLQGIKFFKFLKRARVKYIDFFELIGFVADAEIHIDGKKNKVLVLKKLCAKPPKQCG